MSLSADPPQQLSHRLALPSLGVAARPYGSRSDAAIVVGELLMRHVPALVRGELEIFAIARRPGVLTKVAVRRRPGVRLPGRAVGLVLGMGADYIHQVRTELGGERIDVVRWHVDPAWFISDALGLARPPAMTLYEAARQADVLLGEIDLRGLRGQQGTNLLLAGVLTAWRIRLKRIARSKAWLAVEAAQKQQRSVPAEVIARVPEGLAVIIYGLNALLPTGKVAGVKRHTPPAQTDALLRKRLGQLIQVKVLRLDVDEGHIFVSERSPAGHQLPLSDPSNDVADL